MSIGSKCNCCGHLGNVGSWPWMEPNSLISLCDFCFAILAGKDIAKQLLFYANDIIQEDLVEFGPIQQGVK